MPIITIAENPRVTAFVMRSRKTGKGGQQGRVSHGGTEFTEDTEEEKRKMRNEKRRGGSGVRDRGSGKMSNEQ